MNLIDNLINYKRRDYNQFQNLRDETILKFRFPVEQASDFFHIHCGGVFHLSGMLDRGDNLRMVVLNFHQPKLSPKSLSNIDATISFGCGCWNNVFSCWKIFSKNIHSEKVQAKFWEFENWKSPDENVHCQKKENLF